MKLMDLSLREKVLQTVVLRHKNDRPVTESVGAVFFGGEIITEAEDIGLEAATCPLPMIPRRRTVSGWDYWRTSESPLKERMPTMTM